MDTLHPPLNYGNLLISLGKLEEFYSLVCTNYWWWYSESVIVSRPSVPEFIISLPEMAKQILLI